MNNISGPTFRAPPRVLVVDDYLDSAESMAALLELWGCEAHYARSGLAGLAKAADVAPELVLLDIMLLDMDGFELATRLRELFPSLRIVAMSGFNSPEHLLACKEAGFEAHLVKPVDFGQLHGVVLERS